MNLEIINAFLKVAEIKSLSKTAATINISQSALSKQMIYLEQYFNHKLFQRSYKGVELTSSGEIVYETFLKISTEMQFLKTSLENKKKPVIGALPHIGIDIHHSLLTNSISHDMYIMEDINKLIKQYYDGLIDILFLTDCNTSKLLLSSIRIPICKKSVYVMVHKDNPLWNNITINGTDLIKVPCIYTDPSNSIIIKNNLTLKNLNLIIKDWMFKDIFQFQIMNFIAVHPEYYTFSLTNYSPISDEFRFIKIVDANPVKIVAITKTNQYNSELKKLTNNLH